MVDWPTGGLGAMLNSFAAIVCLDLKPLQLMIDGDF